MYPVREENVAFLEFSRHFRRKGLPVPEIYAEDLSQGAYLEEDLGDTTLFEFLSAASRWRGYRAGGRRGLSQSGGRAAAFSGGGGPRSELQGLLSARELRPPVDRLGPELFQVLFSAAGRACPFNEQALEADFGRLTKFLLSAPPRLFSLSRFSIAQCDAARRAAVFSGLPGRRRGALQYDIASLLFDGKADLPPELRQELLDYYLECLGRFHRPEARAFMEHYYAYVYVRIMQALGAYGFRGFYERKAHFLQSVPYALKNLRWLADNVEAADRAACADRGAGQSVELGEVAGSGSAGRRPDGAIFSFSFHREAAAGLSRATAADLSSTRAACRIPGAKSDSAC